MNDVIFINLYIFLQTHRTRGKVETSPLELEFFIGRFLARGKTPGRLNVSNLIETKKHDVQTDLRK